MTLKSIAHSVMRGASLTLLASLTAVAHAQSAASDIPTGPSFKSLVEGTVVPFFNLAVIPLMYALAFILFLIGIVRYFFMGGEEAREKGKAFIMWGIIGFVVIFSVWGIVNLLLRTLNFAS
ncbi:MAG: pilin [Patescibacteria group bacterium]